MNKPISLIVGIGFTLLAVWLSGCLNEDRGTASIADISRNPSNYIDITVTVKGYYVTKTEDLWGWIYTIKDGTGNILLAELSEGVNESVLVQDKEYYWSGKIVQDGDTAKLIVSDIQPV